MYAKGFNHMFIVWCIYVYTCSYRTYNKKYSFWKMIIDMHFYIEFARYFIRNAYFEDSWVICKQNIHFTKIVINYTYLSTILSLMNNTLTSEKRRYMYIVLALSICPFETSIFVRNCCWQPPHFWCAAPASGPIQDLPISHLYNIYFLFSNLFIFEHL